MFQAKNVAKMQFNSLDVCVWIFQNSFFIVNLLKFHEIASDNRLSMKCIFIVCTYSLRIVLLNLITLFKMGYFLCLYRIDIATIYGSSQTKKEFFCYFVGTQRDVASSGRLNLHEVKGERSSTGSYLILVCDYFSKPNNPNANLKCSIRRDSGQPFSDMSILCFPLIGYRVLVYLFIEFQPYIHMQMT